MPVLCCAPYFLPTHNIPLYYDLVDWFHHQYSASACLTSVSFFFSTYTQGKSSSCTHGSFQCYVIGRWR